MEHEILVALRDALDLAIERSEENVLKRLHAGRVL